jgi:Fe-S-cluster containining protein
VLAEHNRAETVRLGVFLEHGPIARSEVDHRLRVLYDRVRSEIDCTACANCCRELPVALSSSDARRLAERLGQTVREFRAAHVRIRSHRAVFAELPCQFLTGTRCACYADRPAACRSFPHLYQPNLRRVVDDAATCPIVYNVLECLKRELGNRWRRR